VFYLGLLGTPSLRNCGALTLYIALEQPFRLCLDDRRWSSHELAVVPPYAAHRIETDEPLIGAIVIEPESVDSANLPAMFSPALNGQEDLAAIARIRSAYCYLQTIGGGATVAGLDVDRLFFGQELPARRLEPRIAAIVEKIKHNPAGSYTAEQCAQEAGLSFSRFLHLFKDEVGVTFRRFRAWKRARSVLYHVTRSSTLTDVALDVGYPDSTYFSHSIRQVYGLQPKEIFAGSRRLAILLQESAHSGCGREPLGAVS
jgi:AraC-like DNA-binding protein